MVNHAYLVIITQPIKTEELADMIVQAHDVFHQEDEVYEPIEAKVEYIGQTLIKTGV